MVLSATHTTTKLTVTTFITCSALFSVENYFTRPMIYVVCLSKQNLCMVIERGTREEKLAFQLIRNCFNYTPFLGYPRISSALFQFGLASNAAHLLYYSLSCNISRNAVHLGGCQSLSSLQKISNRSGSSVLSVHFPHLSNLYCLQERAREKLRDSSAIVPDTVEVLAIPEGPNELPSTMITVY